MSGRGNGKDGNCKGEYASRPSTPYEDWHTSPRNSGLLVDESLRADRASRRCDDQVRSPQQSVGAFLRVDERMHHATDRHDPAEREQACPDRQVGSMRQESLGDSAHDGEEEEA